MNIVLLVRNINFNILSDEFPYILQRFSTLIAPNMTCSNDNFFLTNALITS